MKGEPEDSIKAVRDVLWKPRAGSPEGRAEWETRVAEGFGNPSSTTPEAQFASELSHRLTRLGWAAYFGQVPLLPLMSIMGDQLVDDWHAASRWIELYRVQQGVTEFIPTGSVSYLRLHAEWLGVLACVYMRRYDYKLAEVVAPDIEAAAKKILKLMRDPIAPAPFFVRSNVRGILHKARLDYATRQRPKQSRSRGTPEKGG